MSKIDIETLKIIVQRNEPDLNRARKIMEDVQAELQALEEEKAERPPPQKKQFAILVSDPMGKLEGLDFTGWVFQIPEDESPQLLEEHIRQAAYDFNATPKGRRLPVQTVGEACEVIPPRLTKEHRVWIKTKTPCLVQRTDNNIPSAPSVD